MRVEGRVRPRKREESRVMSAQTGEFEEIGVGRGLL